MIDYKLKQDIRTLILCLHDPSSENPFSTESLGNYIDDCYWQLTNGHRIRRIPFHLAPALSDANRAIMEMNRIIQENRKGKA